jgi:sec-independent protein translocase protein TatB
MGGLISGKFLFLLIIALIVLGPEKLPEAARAAGRLLSEFRRVTGGLQEEVREAFNASDLAGPVQELRAARDGFREAATGLVSAPFTATRAPLNGPDSAAPGAVSGSARSGASADLPAGVAGAVSSDPIAPVPALTAARREPGWAPAEMGLPPGDPSLN